jgi:hypothetical protein
MRLETEDFRARYATMGEAELIEIARAYDSLSTNAQTALRAEFTHRQLEPPLVDELEPLEPAFRSLVTLRRYRDLSEAIVARSLLESAGIRAWIRDENLGHLEWQISNFIGGLRLQVDATDEEAAVALLTQNASDTIALPGQAEFAQPRCPVCHSTQISFRGSYRGAALTSLYLLSLPFPTGRETWSCDACGAIWEDEESNAEDGSNSSG